MPEPTITKRFVLTRAEDAELNAFLLRLQTASGCKVPLSRNNSVGAVVLARSACATPSSFTRYGPL
ncbi:MAG: hypothetical protein ACKOET_03715, partial [Verrucomicrobiota bacterium]